MPPKASIFLTHGNLEASYHIFILIVNTLG